MISENNNSKKEKQHSLCERFLSKLLHINKEINPKKEAARIAEIFVFFGVIWILLSDKIVAWTINDKHTIVLFSMLKGWVYVLLTGMLVYGLVIITLRKIQQDGLKIDQNYQELCDAYEELEASHEELMASEEELRQQYDSLMDSQKQLLESEERYRLISEATNDGIWDEKDEVRYFSERWFEITGYIREEINRMEDWKKLIHPDDYEATISIMNEHLQGKTPFYCIIFTDLVETNL
ncbi:MAG: PAS domain-containing protein [Herbinix sp.]|nr:PAS domain-containing protein [Herbinix sp.]